MAEGFNLFGFTIKRNVPEALPSFAPQVKDDGASVIEYSPSSVFFNQTYVDMEGMARSDAELITRYRDMMIQPECESAVTQICNEMIVHDDEQEIIECDLEDSQFIPDPIKDAINQSFNKILKLLDFKNVGWQIVQQWYIDGRLYFHAIIDDKQPQAGIQELRPIDPRCIRKVREIIRQKDPRTGAILSQTINEYYIYNEKGFGKQPINNSLGTQSMGNTLTGTKIAKDSIICVTSGLTSASGQVMSYLHSAIKPLNQLRAIEDAAVIYRLVRAPMRRVFYVDTGNMPKMQAEAHVKDMMTRHRNRLVYDPSNGAVKDDRLFQTVLDDFWMARREGNKSTEITTLESQGTLGEMAEVEYFQKRLFRALRVPISRLLPETMYSLGRASEISRDEANFSLFINRLRVRFNMLFLDILEKELILTNIIKSDEWKDFRHEFKFQYARENAFAELKELEILTDRLNVMNGMMPYVGKYWSNDYIRRNILHQDDEDIKKQDVLIMKEMEMLQYRQPLPGEDPLMGGGAAPGAGNAPQAPPMKAKDERAG